MKIAITGGTGFVGGHLARHLTRAGHEVVLIARGEDSRDESLRSLPGVTFVPCGLGSPCALAEAFAGCDAVAHCAGINREMADQTYQRVHIQGTRNVVNAAQAADLKKILLLSFLRARPACGSGYHESKWAAEEIVRASGMDYTVLKAAMIYGKGDHMLDHLSHALHTFPVFALVGMKDRPARPVSIDDVVRIALASLLKGRLSRQTVAVAGPEELLLGEAVQRVARVLGKHPLMFPLPVFVHYALGWLLERVMTVPLVSVSQVRILAEGVVKAIPPCNALPRDLVPSRYFSEEQIIKGLPAHVSFGLRDFRIPWAAATKNVPLPAAAHGHPLRGSNHGG
jgi:NADH dehydrogenase